MPLSCTGADDTFACLVSVPEADLESANEAINGDAFYGLYVVVPVVDGEFIAESPTKTILSGKMNGVRSDHFSFSCSADAQFSLEYRKPILA